MQQMDATATILFDPLRYSPEISLATLLAFSSSSTQQLLPSSSSRRKSTSSQTESIDLAYTTKGLERTARWHTCFRDAHGTDRFPVTLDDQPIADLALDVVNGKPLENGLGFEQVRLPFGYYYWYLIF